jgi:hypothetical protein
MPTARSHDQRGNLRIELVSLAIRIGELDAAIHGIAEIDLTLDHVVPGGRE